MFNLSDETKDSIYKDVFQPSAKELGKTLSLIPRAANVGLSFIDKYLTEKEINIKRAKELLEEKAKNIPEDNLVPPEPYIALPTMQAISYCIDNDSLREMYVNLLLSAMNKNTKEKAHPAFVHIISQLSPDDAMLFTTLFAKNQISIPIAKIFLQKVPNLRMSGQQFETKQVHAYILNSTTEASIITACVNNLTRLGLAEIDLDFSLIPPSLYDYVESSQIYNSQEIIDILNTEELNAHWERAVKKGALSLTDFGQAFYGTCACPII